MTERPEPETSVPEQGSEGDCARSGRRRIRTSHVVLLGTVAIAGIALAFAGIRAADRYAEHGAHAEGGLVLAGWRGGWHGQDRPGMARLCGEQREAWIEDRLGLVESFVDFDAAQRPAWDRLVEAIRAGSARVGETCAALDPEAPPASAPARLERVELMLSAGLDVVREVRPAFDQLYAVLDDEQRAALDRLASRRRGH